MVLATQMHRGTQGNQRGFTLIELMITLVVVAVGVALAVPTYENIQQRRQTTAQAEELAAFLGYAQSEAVKSNELISVELTWTDANNWCIGANEGTAGCDCTEAVTTEPDYCSLNGMPHIMTSVANAKSSMSAYSADTTFVYDPIRGIKNTGDLANHAYTLQSDNADWSLQVNVGPTGRIRVCNPDANKKVSGYDLCTTVSVPPVVVVVPPIVVVAE